MDSIGVHPWKTIHPFHSQCKSQKYEILRVTVDYPVHSASLRVFPL